MKHMFLKSNKGVLWSSLMSAVLSAVADSPVNEDWLFKKQDVIICSIKGCVKGKKDTKELTYPNLY